MAEGQRWCYKHAQINLLHSLRISHLNLSVETKTGITRLIKLLKQLENHTSYLRVRQQRLCKMSPRTAVSCHKQGSTVKKLPNSANCRAILAINSLLYQQIHVQNIWCFQHLESARLLRKYVLQEEIDVTNSNTYYIFKHTGTCTNYFMVTFQL